MIAHGAQKLFGWFGGRGFQETAQIFAGNLGLEPGWLMAALAGGIEFFGGCCLIIGWMTRLSGLAIAATMLVVIIKVHPDAFFAANKGMEYPLVLLLASMSLVFGGAGAISVDRNLSD